MSMTGHSDYTGMSMRPSAAAHLISLHPGIAETAASAPQKAGLFSLQELARSIMLNQDRSQVIDQCESQIAEW